jgi:hypothetical protein
MRKPSELIGNVRFSIAVGLKPWNQNPEEYYLSIVGNIIVCIDDGQDPEAEEQAGEIQLTLIKIAEAINNQANLAFIFDSMDLEEVQAALMEENDTFRLDLKIDAPRGDILFIDSIKLDRKYARATLSWRALEAAFATFASVGVVAAYAPTLDQCPGEWSEYGFERAPGTEIVYRDNYGVHPDRKAY